MKWKLAGVAAIAAAIMSAPVAAAAPNVNGSDNANENAQTRGISVASVAETGASAVVTAIQVFAPDAAQPGLGIAQSHLPLSTVSTTP
jgi:hypothetical protein